MKRLKVKEIILLEETYVTNIKAYDKEGNVLLSAPVAIITEDMEPDEYIFTPDGPMYLERKDDNYFLISEE